MARISDIERASKMAKAKSLYLNGSFSVTYIADNVDVKPETVKDWAKKGNWDELKTSTIMSPKQIQQMILKCAEDIQAGKKPKHSPDELAKLVSAYEKITPKDKNVAYMYDAYTALFDYMLREAKAEKNIKKREALIAFAQKVAEYTDNVINWALNDEQ